MNHPKGGAAWKHLDVTYPVFSAEPRNVRIGHPFRMQRNAFVNGQTYPHLHQKERHDRADIFEDVCGLDLNVFGQGKYSEHRTLMYNVEHNWCKKSIFWELSYWPTQKIRHNIDFVHTEKKNGENELHDVMDVPGKTKNNERWFLPVALHHLLPISIWETITEWCYFFCDMSATTLNVEHVEELGRNIVEIIEHLPIHLPYEALNGGLLQYRWMYPFES
ncbi:hypothetical protein LIER_24283 [Lithospermum erythrorhizon]|uniref:DUF4218 domain-containing protein n=1 Tax=Lithospermum erythrorhizon TaxID=34254 RepID=A0AAV3R6A8_LITER